MSAKSSNVDGYGPQAENIPIEPDVGNATEGSMLNIRQRIPYPLLV